MRVLVTRPQPGAARTAERLGRAGFEPVLLPLTEIRHLPLHAADWPARPDAVAVTSANALRALTPDIVNRLADIPIYCVGRATAAAARRIGFRHVREGSGDATGLAGRLVGDLAAGGSALYLCGRVRTPDFEQRTKSAGLSVTSVEAYDTVAAALSREVVEQAFAAGPIDAILLHSAETARRIPELFAELPQARLSPHLRLICMSQRIASALGRNLPGKISVAHEPSEEALLAELAAQAG